MPSPIHIVGQECASHDPADAFILERGLVDQNDQFLPNPDMNIAIFYYARHDIGQVVEPRTYRSVLNQTIMSTFTGTTLFGNIGQPLQSRQKVITQFGSK